MRGSNKVWSWARQGCLLAMIGSAGCDGAAQADVRPDPIAHAESATMSAPSAIDAPDPVCVEPTEPHVATPEPTPTEPAAPTVGDPEELRAAIRSVVRMTSDRALSRAARAHRMRIQNLSWEDAGRFIGSSVGPNISDVTLEVLERTKSRTGRERVRTHLLPVLRYPNFTDRTADVPADRFFVRVGNQRAGAAPGELETVALSEVLSHLRTYLSDGSSLRGENEDFTAARDTHYLVSAQHVFVPVPDGARVEWAPVLFNYQSNPGLPAVLCLVVTREGTSIQIIENRPDPIYPEGWGQRLYFNHGGARTTFTAERRSDVAERIELGHAEPADNASALDEGADMVAIIQVPLRVPMQMRSMSYGSLAPSEMGSGGVGDLLAGPMGRASDVERAVIGHGLEEGPFHEIRNRRIRRDPRFPIRVTLQFYRATSNGVVSEQDLDDAVATIERVYSDADFVGSLVTGNQARPTSWVSQAE